MALSAFLIADGLCLTPHDHVDAGLVLEILTLQVRVVVVGLRRVELLWDLRWRVRMLILDDHICA